MKKLLLVLSVLSAMALSSCNSMGEYEMPPTYGGQVIYSNVSFLHAVSSEPTNIAFRLYIWLKDGKPGVDDANYKKLFGNLPIGNIVESAGVYTITYPSNYENAYDAKKVGKIEINTGGNLFDNESDTWSISLVGDDPLKIVTRQMNSYNDVIYTFSACYINISYNGFDGWRIDGGTTIDWPKMQNETPQLEWTVSNNITLAEGTGDGVATTFDKFVKGAMTVGAGSYESGTMSIANRRFTWDVDDELTYKMSCKQQSVSAPFISKGALKMSVYTTDPINNPIDSNTFPKTYVEVSFEPVDGACYAKGLLKYNGFQLSF